MSKLTDSFIDGQTGVRIKICGITRPEDAKVAADCRVWAVGLVFYPKSSRFVTAVQALEVVNALPDIVRKVGVFMDTSLDVIRRVEAKVPLDFIQIHGRGAVETARGVGSDRAILAATLQTEADVDAFKNEGAAYVLVDRHRVAGQPSGAAVNWALAKTLVSERKGRTLLAGALTPENVGEAIREVSPFGVDVSGGVESTPGVKDPERIRAFCAAVRKAREK
ncbi:MAG: phosphoribosylanthranilate isomerase [Proteobacteria bacterium]|nr:phosphoribosylanthranilate isomerase [Pseudomonadota bacterium]